GILLATTELYKLSSNGTLCVHAPDCQSGFCADGVCCDTICDAGPCDVCSVRTDVAPLGSPAVGSCAPLTGPACDDPNACTQTDTCQNGVCTGQNPIMCPMPDQCHKQDACNTKTGVCPLPVAEDNILCDDGDLCTPTDICQSGVCTGQ